MSGARRIGRRVLKRLLDARWTTRIGLRLNRRTRRLSATAIALARRGRSAACLRIRVALRPDRNPTARFTLLGSATILGRLTTRTGSARPLPTTCRRLR